MTCDYRKRIVTRMGGRQEEHLYCEMGIPSLKLPEACEDCYLAHDPDVICAKCGRVMYRHHYCRVDGLSVCDGCIREMVGAGQ